MQLLSIADYVLSDEAKTFMDTPQPESFRRQSVDQSWFVAFVSPLARSPDRVEKFVQRLGFEAYWPRARRQKKVPVCKSARGKNRKFKIVDIVSPVLPRYVLVRLPSASPPFGMLTCDEARFNGVCGLVTTASRGEPTVMPDSKVEEFRTREAAGEWESLIPSRPQVGSTVRIVGGPFAMFDAMVEQWIAEERLKVSVRIFGRASSIELNDDQVEQFA